MTPPANFIYGFTSLRSLWSLSRYIQPNRAYATLKFLTYVLWECIPHVVVKAHGWHLVFFLFSVGIIRGPYVCYYCGRATTQGPNLIINEPAFCWRRACIHANSIAMKET